MIQSEPRVVCEVVGEANERTKNDLPGSTEPTPTLVDDTKHKKRTILDLTQQLNS